MLLWFETLALGLLLTATLIACAGRWQRRGTQWFGAVLAVLFALAPFAALTALTAVLQFHVQITNRLFYPTTALTVFFVIGVVVLLIRGMRRGESDDEAPTAAGWPRGKLAIATVVAAALLAMTFWNLDLAVRQRMTELRTEAGALALSVAPARVSDRENAALLYERAFEAMHAGEPWPEALTQWHQWLQPGEAKPDWQDPALRKFLDERRSAFVLLRQAAAKPSCFFDRDYGRPSIEMLLPEVNHMRDASRLLALGARCKAADGDINEALQYVNAVFAMAEHAGSEPLLVSMLVSAAIQETAIDTLQAVLETGNITRHNLEEIQLNENVSFRRLFERSLRMEEAFGMTVFCEIGDAFSLDELTAVVESDDAVPIPGVASAYRVFVLSEDVAAHRRFVTKFRQAASQPYHQAKKQWEGFDEELQADRVGVIARLLLPTVAGCARQAARFDARRRAALLAVAACRYRAEHDRLPDKLDDLAPKFIAVLPGDPFDGKAMKMKKTDPGLVIYSVGPDLVDDGGVTLEQNEQTGKSTGDITFQVPDGPR